MYAEWCSGETELYNITADPYQLVNLARGVRVGMDMDTGMDTDMDMGMDMDTSTTTNATMALLQELASVLASVYKCKAGSCPGGAQMPVPDPHYVRTGFKCEWPLP